MWPTKTTMVTMWLTAGRGRMVCGKHLQRQCLVLAFLVDVSHVNQFVLKLVHRPHLTALLTVLDKHRRLTHKTTPLCMTDTHTHSPTSAPVSMGFITSAVGTGLKKQPVIIPLKCLARVCFYISVTEHLNLLNVTVNVLVCIAFWNINYCTFSYTPNRYDRRVFSVVSQKAWNSLAEKHIIIIIIIIQHLYSAIVSYAGCRGANYLILVYVACQAFLTILTCNIYLLTYLLPGCNGVNVSSYYVS